MDKKNLRDKIAGHITNVMLEKHCEGNEEFGEWIVTNKYATDIVEELSNSEKLNKKLRNFKCADKEKDALLLITKIERIQKRRRFIISATAVASAILFLSLIVWQGTTSKNDPIIIAEEKTNEAFQTPRLLLSGGDTIELDKISDTITIDGVLKSADIVKITPQTNDREKVQLVVPSKCTYTLMLSDGTKVILNSNSKLLFPQTFMGETRDVELIGEGYFEVEKDNKRPFIVRSGDYKVEVHGTKFNMNCYDHSMKTFLLEGSVSVSINNGEKETLLPMQVASINSNSFEVENVTESDIYLSWLNDNFVFNAIPLDVVVSMLERWYGVQFNKSFSVDKPVFITGMFDRKIDLPELLKLIEKVAGIEIINKEGIYHIKAKSM